MKTLISNGTLVTPEGVVQADLMLDGGRIRAIGQRLQADGAAIVDASGKIVLPGGVDVHTHISLDIDAAPAPDLFYTGTLPALAGGTTSIVDHLAFAPAGRSLHEQIERYKGLADGQAAVDYGFHAVAQDMSAETLAELPLLRRQGINSLKAYMTYAHRLDDAAMLSLMKQCKKLGLLLAVHAEDHDCVENGRATVISEGKLDPVWHAKSRPPECEAKAIRRFLHLAREAGDCPVYIVHLSTAAGLQEIRQARATGQRHIFAETCPQYLCLTEDRYADPEEGLKFIMSPPLRGPEDAKALWQGLRDGDIQTVATDHCTFTLAEKRRGRGDFTRCPGGAPGLEERLPLMFGEGVAKGRISLERFVELVASAPARLFGLYPQKGALLPGSDADLVILNLEARYAFAAADMHGPGDFSIYEGMETQGRIDAVYLRGHLAVKNGRLTEAPRKAGNFLQRESCVFSQ